MARHALNPGRRSRTSRGETVFFSRTVFCSLAGISQTQLSVWESEELLVPAREAVPGAAEPLYDREGLRRVRVIRTLAEDFEVNLPGIGVILHLLDQLAR